MMPAEASIIGFESEPRFCERGNITTEEVRSHAHASTEPPSRISGRKA